MNNYRYYAAWAAFFLLPAGAFAQNGPPDDHGIFSAVWENDIFGDQDGNYTNGFRLAWMSSEKNQPEWVNWAAENLLPIDADGHKRVSIALGQSMFTPDDIEAAVPDPNDRPYAGWLYTTVGVVSDTGSTLDSAMLTLGIVGQNALGEQTQEFVHDLIDDRDPNGWDYQLHTEPGIIFTFERQWRNFYQISPLGFGFDATPKAGVNLGNIFTDAMVGATFRFGQDLPADYGPPRIRPSLPGSDFFIPAENFGWYLFAGVEGRAVARNIFLDGNTFEDSPSVDKENFVGNLQTGLAMTFGDVRISYTHVFNTREFKTQTTPSQFGAVTLSYRF